MLAQAERWSLSGTINKSKIVVVRDPRAINISQKCLQNLRSQEKADPINGGRIAEIWERNFAEKTLFTGVLPISGLQAKKWTPADKSLFKPRIYVEEFRS